MCVDLLYKIPQQKNFYLLKKLHIMVFIDFYLRVMDKMYQMKMINFCRIENVK